MFEIGLKISLKELAFVKWVFSLTTKESGIGIIIRTLFKVKGNEDEMFCNEILKKNSVVKYIKVNFKRFETNIVRQNRIKWDTCMRRFCQRSQVFSPLRLCIENYWNWISWKINWKLNLIEKLNWNGKYSYEVWILIEFILKNKTYI